MYDIAEKLTKNERDNAKYALDQLWALKKNLSDENRSETIDLLIIFYQSKQEIEDCNVEIEQLQNKIKELKVREQELILIDRELEKEYSDVLKVSNRLKAKIVTLGNNYMIMLTEQMKRYCGAE
jgi:hypothetical protein